MSHAGGSIYPRGNSRSATATPTGSPKRRLPQIPGQGPPPNRGSRLQRGATDAGIPVSGSGMLGGHAPTATSLTRNPALTTSYDGGLNGRGHSLHPSNRSQSMGYSSGYGGGGYSDTELMHTASQDRSYYDGRGYGQTAAPVSDPYYENMGRGGMAPSSMSNMGPTNMGNMGSMGSMGNMGSTSYLPTDDRRAQPPPPPPRNVNFEGDPPTRGSGGPRGAPPVGRSHFEGLESDMHSVTSALSSQTAPHQRARRPG